MWRGTRRILPGGLVGSGQSIGTANVTNDNDAYVNDNAQIVAGGNITIQASSGHIADAGASSDGGGLIDEAEADTFSDIGHDTRARTGTNSKLTAGGTISIQGLSNTQAYTDSEADAGGLGADASANDQSRGDDDPGGVRIGVASDALTQVQVGAGSQLTAAHVQLNATVNGSRAVRPTPRVALRRRAPMTTRQRDSTTGSMPT